MITLKNEYTCQALWCGKSFESEVDLKILPNLSPCCSIKCLFANTLKKFKKKDLSDNIKYFFKRYPLHSLFYNLNYPKVQQFKLIDDNAHNHLRSFLCVKGGVYHYQTMI